MKTNGESKEKLVAPLCARRALRGRAIFFSSDLFGVLEEEAGETYFTLRQKLQVFLSCSRQREYCESEVLPRRRQGGSVDMRGDVGVLSLSLRSRLVSFLIA